MFSNCSFIFINFFFSFFALTLRVFSCSAICFSQCAPASSPLLCVCSGFRGRSRRLLTSKVNKRADWNAWEFERKNMLKTHWWQLVCLLSERYDTRANDDSSGWNGHRQTLLQNEVYMWCVIVLLLFETHRCPKYYSKEHFFDIVAQRHATLRTQHQRKVPVKFVKSGVINPRWSKWLDQQLFDQL